MKYKGYRQKVENDCGKACLKTVLKYYHKNSGFFGKRELLSLQDIIVESRRNHLLAVALHGEWNEFVNDIRQGKIILPLIVHLEKEFGSHFEVVFEIMGNKVLSFDPAHDFIVYKTEDFRKLWTGYIIAFGGYNDQFDKEII